VESFVGRSPYEVKDLDGNIVVAASKRLSQKRAERLLNSGLKWVEYPAETLVERHLSQPIFDPESGEILYDVVTPLDEIKLKRIIDSGIESFFIADDLADGANDSIIKSSSSKVTESTLRLLRQTEDDRR